MSPLFCFFFLLGYMLAFVFCVLACVAFASPRNILGAVSTLTLLVFMLGPSCGPLATSTISLKVGSPFSHPNVTAILLLFDWSECFTFVFCVLSYPAYPWEQSRVHCFGSSGLLCQVFPVVVPLFSHFILIFFIFQLFPVKTSF